MNQSVVSSLILLLIFLVIHILLALAYHSLINARKNLLAELAAAGKRNARLALQISQDASHLVNAYQLSVVTLRFLSAGLAAVGLAPGAAVWFVNLGMDEMAALTLAEMLMLLLGAAVMLIFGSQIPSVVGSAYADRLALVFARPAHVFIRLLTPVSALMRLISDGFVRLLGIQAQVTYVTEEEIMTLVDAGQEEGVIENEEKEMIYSIFQLGETAVREVMVPRLDMVAVPLDTPLDDVVKTVLAAGHSRIPVYQDNIDHVRGLLYAKDLLRLWERGGSETSGLADLLRPAYFVPEGKSAMALLQEMQQKRVHLAVVVDEYGGTAGLVTLEDLIEEIIGEVQDEYDFNEVAAYEQVSDSELVCNARLDLDDLNHLLGVTLPTDESDTLGGFIFARVGEVPEPGAVIETDEVRLEVLTVDQRRIGQVRVTRLNSVELPDETLA